MATPTIANSNNSSNNSSCQSSYNTVIKNGHVIDVHNGLDAIADVYIQNGCISKIIKHSDRINADSDNRNYNIGVDGVITNNGLSHVGNESRLRCGDFEYNNEDLIENCVDASGCIVTSGLVDCHVHAYRHATPLGIDVDRTCLARGVTTAVDAGSAGSSTFSGFDNLIRKQCKTKLYAFLHIAKHGLAAAGCSGLKPGGECDSLNAVDPDTCHDVISQNKEVIVGVKVRLAASVADDGKNEQEILRRALQASARSQVPLMVHHSLSTVPHEGHGDKLGCPGSLRPGDIYTHCFHGHQANILDPNTGRVAKACWDAKRRGVHFDLGHGQGSFSWTLAEQCVSEGFWPDSISTDLHTESEKGPAYSLLCTMTKMLHLGMPLSDVIAAVTCKPAAAIGKLTEIGHLGQGMPADVTILKLVDLDPPVDLEDSFGETRSIGKSLELSGVIIGAQQQPVFTLRLWPNPTTVQQCLARRSQYKVK